MHSENCFGARRFGDRNCDDRAGATAIKGQRELGAYGLWSFPREGKIMEDGGWKNEEGRKRKEDFSGREGEKILKRFDKRQALFPPTINGVKLAVWFLIIRIIESG